MPRNVIPPRNTRTTINLLAFLIALAMGNLSFGQQPKSSGQDDPARIAEFDQSLRVGRLDELEPRLKSYIDHYKNSFRAYYLLGYVYYHLRKPEDAVKALSRSLELNEQNAQAHMLLGRAFMKAEKCEQARRALERAVQLEPHSAEGRYYLGRSFSAQENYDKASEEFEQAIRLNPDYAEAYNALGFALEAMGDDAKAQAKYERAIEISRKQQKPFEAPYVNMSSYYNLHGDVARGMEYAKRALAINPQSDLAFFQLARAYRAGENWPEAAGALEHAIALMPGAPQYQYALSGVYRKMGKIPESQVALAKFRELEEVNAERETRRHSMRVRPMGIQRSEGAYERE